VYTATNLTPEELATRKAYFESAESQEMQAKARAYLDKSYEDFKADCFRDPNPFCGISYEQLEKIMRRAFCVAVMGPHPAA
jgi:hypothetical protein